MKHLSFLLLKSVKKLVPVKGNWFLVNCFALVGFKFQMNGDQSRNIFVEENGLLLSSGRTQISVEQRTEQSKNMIVGKTVYDSNEWKCL